VYEIVLILGGKKTMGESLNNEGGGDEKEKGKSSSISHVPQEAAASNTLQDDDEEVAQRKRGKPRLAPKEKNSQTSVNGAEENPEELNPPAQKKKGSTTPVPNDVEKQAPIPNGKPRMAPILKNNEEIPPVVKRRGRRAPLTDNSKPTTAVDVTSTETSEMEVNQEKQVNRPDSVKGKRRTPTTAAKGRGRRAPAPALADN